MSIKENNQEEQIENLYSKTHFLLDKYYPLVKQVNAGSLSKKELGKIFQENLVDEIINVNNRFTQTSKIRTCGNPAFVHSLRVLLWLKIFDADEKLLRVALYHDLLEDFSNSLEQMESESKTIPEELLSNILQLTNRHGDVIKTLEKERVKQSLIPDGVFFEKLFDSEIFSEVSERLKSCLQKNSLQTVKRESYECYLQDLKRYVVETEDEIPYIVKLADRLDNTLSDWPSKFTSIIKIYSKNELVLKYSEDIVRNSTNVLFKIFFILVVERSLDQIRFLIHNYSIIVDKRGLFYGEQYNKLLQQLKDEQEKLKPFEKLKNELLDDEDLKLYINNLQGTN